MDRVIISSFDRRILERLARMPAPPALAFISDAGADPEIMGVLRTIKAFSWHPRRTVLTREQVERVHAEGMKVFPWTINTRTEADALCSWGSTGSSATTCRSCGRFEAQSLWPPRFDQEVIGTGLTESVRIHLDISAFQDLFSGLLESGCV